MPKFKCCGCKDRFDGETMIKLPAGRFHSIDCSISYFRAKQEKARAKQQSRAKREHREKLKAVKRAHRADKERIKSRGDWIKDVQAVFNRFIRLRDAREPCISCQRHHSGQYHAGHYRSTGSTPELRFEESNCHKQCSPCNNHLSGNIVNYRPRLIQKIGQAAVDWIEGPHEPKKYTIDDLKALKKKYQAKIKIIQ